MNKLIYLWWLESEIIKITNYLTFNKIFNLNIL